MGPPVDQAIRSTPYSTTWCIIDMPNAVRELQALTGLELAGGLDSYQQETAEKVSQG